MDRESRRFRKQRQAELEQLYDRFAPRANRRNRWVYWRKRIVWQTVLRITKGLKRVVDVLLSMAALIALSPLMATVALLIKLDGGPAIYWSKRVGKWGQEFDFPKFRSMKVEAERLRDQLENDHGASITFKHKTDPRCTWIGKYLRKLSIDELPQLYSVLIGEMTLVGPRPPLPSEVLQYSAEERRRLDVTPGLTCIWQVSGRSDIPFDQQVSLDVEYIQSQSFWLDLKILLKTIPAVLLGKGAY